MEGGATTTLTGTAIVGDAALTAAGNPNLLSTNPVTNPPVATFTDSNPSSTILDFTASIDWGDGATSGGIVSGPDGGPFTVTGTHTYATLGTKTITVHIVDDGGATATAFSHLILFAYPTGGNFVIGNATIILYDSRTARWTVSSTEEVAASDQRRLTSGQSPGQSA